MINKKFKKPKKDKAGLPREGYGATSIKERLRSPQMSWTHHHLSSKQIEGVFVISFYFQPNFKR